MDHLPPAERATLQHAVARGYLRPDQIQAALPGGAGVLHRLRPLLSPAAVAELTQVYLRAQSDSQRMRASGVFRAPTELDPEKTVTSLDSAALAASGVYQRPTPDTSPDPTLHLDSGATLRLGPGQTSGVGPGLADSASATVRMAPGAAEADGEQTVTSLHSAQLAASSESQRLQTHAGNPSQAGPAFPTPADFGGGSTVGHTVGTLSAGGEALRIPLPVEGEQLAEYTIVKELARGGMGAVYVATHPGHAQEVALKVMLGGEDPTEVERFHLEAKALSQLQHDNVVAVHDMGNFAGRHYLVMDLVSGDSLKQRIDRTGPLPINEGTQLGFQLADAMALAHARGILHRDLKPANVLLDEVSGFAKITDFGLAKDLNRDGESLTQTGQVLGTPAYMAPEQAAGEKHLFGPATDVYGLGATIYATLTGKAPYGDSDAIGIIKKVLTEDPPPPSELRPEIDDKLQAIVLKCLEKDPGHRYQTGAELRDDLQAYLFGKGIKAGVATGLVRARRKRRAAMAVALLAVGFLGVRVWEVIAERRAFAAEAASLRPGEEAARELRASAWPAVLADLAAEEDHWRSYQRYDGLVGREAPELRTLDVPAEALESARAAFLELHEAYKAAQASKRALDLEGASIEALAEWLRGDSRRLRPDEGFERNVWRAIRRKLGKPVRVLEIPDGGDTQGVFLNEHQLVTGGEDCWLRRWDLRSGEERLLSRFYASELNSEGEDIASTKIFSLAATAGHLWVAYREHKARRRSRVLRIPTAQLDELPRDGMAALGSYSLGSALPEEARASAVAATSSRAIVGYESFHTARLFTCGSGDPVALGEVSDRVTGPTRSVAFSADGRFYAASGDFGALSVYSTATGEQLWQQDDVRFQGEAPAFSPGDRFLVVAALGELYLYERRDEAGKEWVYLGGFVPDLPKLRVGANGSKNVTFRGLSFGAEGRLLWVTFGKEGERIGEGSRKEGKLGGIVTLVWSHVLRGLRAAPGQRVPIKPLSANLGFSHDLDRIHVGPGRRSFAVASWVGKVHVLEGDGHLAGLNLEPLLSLSTD